ncbi:MAG: hypothetical protein CFE21_01595 [Bacteroidetes bacterium B1(2017)]|nr:MAG: hypothetical protein CFE21_01595 [Bacteroidetes bacterium B1(2017)]
MQANLFSKNFDIYSNKGKLEILPFVWDKGIKLRIKYCFAETQIGRVLMASTDSGICWLALVDEDESCIHELKREYPNAILIQEESEYHTLALLWFEPTTESWPNLKLHIKGTEFQLKVWKALIEIPFGNSSTYTELAAKLGVMGGSRAVGNAVGRNCIAYLIPCHRVLLSTGKLSGFRWGVEQKKKMLEWEQSHGL